MRRTPEIVLGFLIATAFWSCFLLWHSQKAVPNSQAQPAQTEQQHTKSGGAVIQQEQHSKGGQKSNWYDTFLNYTPDWFVAIFTGLLSFVTYRLVTSTGGLKTSTDRLWEAGERQIELSRETAAAQSRDMRESLSIAQEAATTATTANTIAREAYVTEHRPWLTVEMSLAGDINFQENGFVSTAVAVRVTNIGTTPASGVYFSAHMWTGVDIDRNPSPLIYRKGRPFSVEGEIQAYLEMLTRPNAHFAKFVLLPNEHITRTHGVLAAYDANTVIFDVFACAVYNAPGIEGFRHTVAVNKVWCLPAESGVRIMAKDRVGFDKESGGSAT
jgi:hypothetical protein